MPIRTAVVIEDTEGDRELIVQLLHGAGIERVYEHDALPSLFDPPLDESTLVVLDLVLGPGADGVQALEAFARLGARDAPIVIVSGQLASMLSVVETYGKALGLKVVATSGKPIATDLFASLLRELNGG